MAAQADIWEVGQPLSLSLDKTHRMRGKSTHRPSGYWLSPTAIVYPPEAWSAFLRGAV
jgi:hypothetical protein